MRRVREAKEILYFEERKMGRALGLIKEVT
jgi:hypothetical protein